jgi:hypothetical protein
MSRPFAASGIDHQLDSFRLESHFLAARQVIGGQFAFRNIEQLAHASVRQIENSQSFGARSTDTPYDFEGRDSSGLVVAE